MALYWLWAHDNTFRIHEECPPDLVWQSEASIRLVVDRQPLGNVTLCRQAGDEKYEATRRVTLHPQPQRPEYSVPVLKSNLQKAVRRRHLGAALSSLTCLLYQDPTELLRRLPIIMIEDVCLRPGFEAIIWLMLAHSKGYPLSPHDVWLLYAVMADLIQYPDVCPHESHVCRWTVQELWTSAQTSSLHLACAARLAYGGMNGDMKLLKRVAETCVIKCEHHLAPVIWSDALTGLFQWTVKRPMTEQDQLPSAIDFHCTSIMFHLLPVVGVSEVVLRKTIWDLSSGYNVRRQDPVPKKPLWWTTIAQPYLEKNWRKYWAPL